MNSPMSIDRPVSTAELVQMGRKPGPFVIALDGQTGRAVPVSCHEVVRGIPGRRLVCRGQWQGQDVFVKLYFGTEKCWRDECQGLMALNNKGIAAPTVLHAGTADHGKLHVILLQAIQPAVTLETACELAADEAERIELLRLAVAVIASHHMAGLEQCDIHLNNFLLSAGRLYTLDGGGIHRSGKDALPVNISRDNLALFFAQFYPIHDALVDTVLAVYLERRSWTTDVIDAAGLKRRIRYFRRHRLRRFMKKVFRDCSAFACDSSWRYFRVYDRSMASREMVEFLDDLDASLQHAESQYLKQGNTCTLWRVPVDGRQLVVKRYNIKGTGHRFNRAFRQTRAAISWMNAHRLGMYGIPTARPVALVEERMGPLRGRAWFVSEYVEGDAATGLCTRQGPDPDDMQLAVTRVTGVLAQLAQCKISHGDMKGSNFILSGQQAVVIDLDSMRQHLSSLAFRQSQRRDMRRFMRNWEACPEVAAMFGELMRNRNLVTGT
jgi:tRNA A-37 threonylcarbamoyl transferase component Bud32